MSFWYAGSGRNLYLKVNLADARCCLGPGDVTYAVQSICALPEIKEQTSQWDICTLRDELREYGAWDDIELLNHDDNIERMVWIACGDVAENPKDYEEN